MFKNEEKTMRIKNLFPDHKAEGEVIAEWGGAKLIKRLDGKLELRGGSKDGAQCGACPSVSGIATRPQESRHCLISLQ